MNPDRDQNYCAVAIEGTLFAHAHIVDFLVETGDGYALLPDIIRGRNRVRSNDELQDLVGRDLATMLAESIRVGDDDAGLLLNQSISQLLARAGFDTLANFDRRVETVDDHVVVVAEVEELAELRKTLADELTKIVRGQIVDKLVAEVLGEEADFVGPDWEALDTWTEYAIDCGAGGLEDQYQALLTRAWLLGKQLESTQVSNLYDLFLSETLTREQFDSEIDVLERLIRSAVERRLWLRRVSQEVAEGDAEDIDEIGESAKVIDIADHTHHPRDHVG